MTFAHPRVRTPVYIALLVGTTFLEVAICGPNHRFVWVDPDLHSGRSESSAPLEVVLKESHANGVVVPAILEGMAVYPSRLLSATGDLTAWRETLDRCRGAGLATAIYVQAFIHGGNIENASHLARQNPGWLSSDRTGLSMESILTQKRSGHMATDGFFFDPGIPRVREFFLATVLEAARFADADWLILDHVRYPIVEPALSGAGIWEQIYGYHPAARSAFESEFGADPLSFGGNPAIANDRLGTKRLDDLRGSWRGRRKGWIDGFLRDVRQALAENFPNMRLATVCYPDPVFATEVAFQDWPAWIRKGWVDAVLLPNNEGGAVRIRRDLYAPHITKALWESVPLKPDSDPVERLRQTLSGGTSPAGMVLFDASLIAGAGVAAVISSAWDSPQEVSTVALNRPETQEEGRGEPPRDETSSGFVAADVRALYGFKPEAPPFAGLRPQEIAARLAEYGFNAVFGGSDKADIRSELDRVGIRRYAEFPLFVGERHWKTHPESQPVAANGRKLQKTKWYAPVCPNQEWLREAKLDSLVRMAEEENLHGVWLDFIRYPVFWEEVPPFLPDTCFCPVCLRLFEAETGHSPSGGDAMEKAEWILDRVPHEWYRWRANRILAFVRAAADRLHQSRPGSVLGAFVLPWEENEHSGALYKVAGQDLSGFAEEVDVLSPMLYFHQLGKPPTWVRDRIIELGSRLSVPILPILQCYDLPTPIPEIHLQEALRLGREPPSRGIVLFSQRHLETTGRWGMAREALKRG